MAVRRTEPGGNGIAIYGGAAGTITGNTISDIIEPITYPNIYGAGFGVLIQCSQGIIMSGNNVSDVQVGVFAQSSSGCGTGNADANTITKNTFSQTHIFDAVYVCGNYNLVQSNTMNGTSEAAIRIDGSCYPGVSGYFNTFASNTINEACTPSLLDPTVAASNTFGSNTSYNVSYDQLFGTVLAPGFCNASGAPSSPVLGETAKTHRPPSATTNKATVEGAFWYGKKRQQTDDALAPIKAILGSAASWNV